MSFVTGGIGQAAGALRNLVGMARGEDVAHETGQRGEFWEGAGPDHVEAVCDWTGEPGALARILQTCGIGRGPGNGWMHAKLAVVALTLGYHHGCGVLLRCFEAGLNRRSHTWYRWFNELPVLMLVAAVVLVVVKPF